ncbi:MAG TPA: tRNA (adenosine(37)-N6)-threonylcarbamoyltransferase complex ATPase subunit type 1 TsaE [Solirubrobacteraceae bacterium]|jgi:tRNA threonylcarbamoyladenosine biosynthesis protein TsaE|nr:tRNA (adenosine(37)-N6)-threonylcarbamoyltransferase complex ATPase subunit type 1 TsaE [Solirubrobacteraceae bacterium]
MCAASERSPGSRIIESSGPGDTERAGAELAGDLRPGAVVLVAGDLGTGKTTLVRGACRALGVTGPITSPTFTIGNLYESAVGAVAHLDLYRLAGLDREDPDLLGDYLGPGRIAFIEWPDRAAAELACPTRSITLSHRGGDRRLIEVTEGSR